MELEIPGSICEYLEENALKIPRHVIDVVKNLTLGKITLCVVRLLKGTADIIMFVMNCCI